MGRKFSHSEIMLDKRRQLLIFLLLLSFTVLSSSITVVIVRHFIISKEELVNNFTHNVNKICQLFCNHLHQLIGKLDNLMVFLDCQLSARKIDICDSQWLNNLQTKMDKFGPIISLLILPFMSLAIISRRCSHRCGTMSEAHTDMDVSKTEGEVDLNASKTEPVVVLDVSKTENEGDGD